MKRIFVDTNVIIDVLMQREGFLASAKVLALSKQENFTLYGLPMQETQEMQV